MSGGAWVVGSFNVDHVWTLDALPVPGETRSAAYSSGPGGKGFNQAVAAARSGAPTRFCCALGEDAGGVLARALAVADGIDLRDVRCDLPTGSAGIFVDAHGRNSIAVAPGANGALQAGHVEAAFGGTDAPAVVLAQLETPVDAVARALELARERGALAVLNPAPANAEVDAGLLALADVLTPNETEFAALLQRHAGIALAPDDVAGLDDARLHTHCRALARGTVVVTLGAAGCFVSHGAALHGDREAAYRVQARPVRAVDTTGAGDAFNGALCAALAGGAPSFGEAVAFASAYAALSTERPGAAASMPRRDDVHARFGL
ncbi:MAG: ribokinase [Pseudomonadota bacterium]